MNRVNFLLCGVLGLLIWFGMVSCTETPAEEAIRANIKSMQQAAEDKSPRKAVEFLADNFTGNQGIDKTGLRRLMAVIFLKHQNINVVISRLDIEVNQQDPYSAGMSAVVIVSGAQNILPQDGRIYQITGEWQYIDGDWMLVHALWD